MKKIKIVKESDLNIQPIKLNLQLFSRDCDPTCDPKCTPVCSPSCRPCFPFGKCNPDLFREKKSSSQPEEVEKL